MRRLVFLFLLGILSLLFVPQVYAIEDPLAVPNNKFGISILFDSELAAAAALIHANGGDWGYVTIPVQANDRNFTKWQRFMDACKRLHLIPLIRLATEGDLADTSVWRKASAADIVDFATFLNTLKWPTKNRYVIVFNEVNRFDEWGGSVNPAEYANILSYAVTAFKSTSQDFFIISAGLDNAAPNQGTKYMNQYKYMNQMDIAVPGIFNQIDGLASHSYPNPAFAQPPNSDSKTGVASFSFERALAQSLSAKQLPVFITETGWSSEKVSADQQSQYYEQAFASIWTDPGIVAVTPFLLQAMYGPFQQFSFFEEGGKESKQYMAIRDLPKLKGSPALAPTETPTPTPTLNPTPSNYRKKPVKVLGTETSRGEYSFFVSKFIQNIFQFLLGRGGFESNQES